MGHPRHQYNFFAVNPFEDALRVYNGERAFLNAHSFPTAGDKMAYNITCLLFLYSLSRASIDLIYASFEEKAQVRRK